MIRRPPRSTRVRSSAASDVYKRQLQHLGRERDGYSALKLDRHALEGEDLGLILSMGRPDCIQVFYRRDFDSAEISLLDERNALWRQRQALRDERSLLAPLQRFLQSLLYRRNAPVSYTHLTLPTILRV